MPPRPTATSSSVFAVAALGTAAVLTGVVIGVSQLGVVRDPSGHIGGRIMAVPQTTSTSPFSWFGAKARLPITIPPEYTASGPPSLNAAGGDTTGQSNSGSVAAAAAVPARTRSGVRHQGVTTVSAVLKVPSARAAARPVVSVVSPASAYPSAIVALVPAHTPPAVVVPGTSSERPVESSEREARHHADKAPKRKLSHAKAAKATRST